MNFRKALSTLTAVCITVLTGCAKISDDLYPFPKGSYDEPEPFEHTDEHIAGDELAAAVDAFPIEKLTAPDGSTVSKYDAARGGERSLGFDFGFYKIAAPIFGTSFDDPDIIEYDDSGSLRYTIDLTELANDVKTDCRKAVKGDVLENGLVVDHACCGVGIDGKFGNIYVFLKGEVTLSGYLAYEFHPNHEQSDSNGTLWFIPDTTNGDVPTYYNLFGSSVCGYWGDPKSKNPYFLYSDSCPWMLGNTKSEKYAEFDLEEIFDGKSYVAVNVTIKESHFGKSR